MEVQAGQKFILFVKSGVHFIINFWHVQCQKSNAFNGKIVAFQMPFNYQTLLMKFLPGYNSLNSKITFLILLRLQIFESVF